MKQRSSEGRAYQRVYLLTPEVAKADIKAIENRGMERLKRVIRTERIPKSLTFFNFLTEDEKQDIAELRLGLALNATGHVFNFERGGSSLLRREQAAQAFTELYEQIPKN